MAIAIRSEGVSSSTNAQTIECTAPGTISDGDLLRILVGVTDDVTISVNESGWTEVGQTGDATGLNRKIGAFIKIASSESGDYTVDISGGVDKFINVQCTAFSGADQGTPEDVSAVLDAYTSTATYDPDAITPVTANAWVETCLFARGSSLDTPTVPSGYTDSADDGEKTANAFLGAAYIDAGAVDEEDPPAWGSTTVTCDCSGIVWAMRPAGSSTNIMTLRQHYRMLGQ